MIEINEERIIKYLILSKMTGIGPVTQNAILNLYNDIDRCFTADETELIHQHTPVVTLGNNTKPSSSPITKKRIKLFTSQRNDKELQNKAEHILATSKKTGIDLITREDIKTWVPVTTNIW